eukprot:m.34084 g.34084  ORF g.34084 m.34084 type:complete len:82 (-) comp14276_c0_seq6:765-1010(-)
MASCGLILPTAASMLMQDHSVSLPPVNTPLHFTAQVLGYDAILSADSLFDDEEQVGKAVVMPHNTANTAHFKTGTHFAGVT